MLVKQVLSIEIAPNFFDKRSGRLGMLDDLGGYCPLRAGFL